MQYIRPAQQPPLSYYPHPHHDPSFRMNLRSDPYNQVSSSHRSRSRSQSQSLSQSNALSYPNNPSFIILPHSIFLPPLPSYYVPQQPQIDPRISSGRASAPAEPLRESRRSAASNVNNASAHAYAPATTTARSRSTSAAAIYAQQPPPPRSQVEPRQPSYPREQQRPRSSSSSRQPSIPSSTRTAYDHSTRRDAYGGVEHRDYRPQEDTRIRTETRQIYTDNFNPVHYITPEAATAARGMSKTTQLLHNVNISMNLTYFSVL